ncbi:MAG: hypothetical protein AAGH15_27205 [Myxococcota bacterium]
MRIVFVVSIVAALGCSQSSVAPSDGDVPDTGANLDMAVDTGPAGSAREVEPIVDPRVLSALSFEEFLPVCQRYGLDVVDNWRLTCRDPGWITDPAEEICRQHFETRDESCDLTVGEWATCWAAYFNPNGLERDEDGICLGADAAQQEAARETCNTMRCSPLQSECRYPFRDNPNCVE